VRLDELRHIEQCLKRDQGLISLWKLTAMNWIEHPSRNGDLESFGELNYETLLVEPAQGAHYFDFRSIKWVMSIMDLLKRKFVSSMMIPCGTVLRLIFWKPGWISKPFRRS
jgi:hypothetical protein